jgi:hypothetical protein
MITERQQLNVKCAIEYYGNEGYIITRSTQSYIVMFYADDYEFTDKPTKHKYYLRNRDYTFFCSEY